MGVESYRVLWVFTDECCHPNRFRVELMLIESFEIGRLDFPNCDTLQSTHCPLSNEIAMELFRLIRPFSGEQSDKYGVICDLF